MIDDFSLYIEFSLLFMYSIFLRVIQHFYQVPYLSLQFKGANHSNGHVIEGKIEGRIEVKGRGRKRSNQLLDDITEK
jgi:hypothetical protein